MARRQRPMPVSSLLAEASGSLRPILRRAARMQTEDARLRALLDTEVSEQVDAMHVRGDTLVIVVRSSVWATRVRFLAPVILERFADDGSSPLAHVRVVVGSGAPDAPAYRPPRPRPLGAEAADVLSHTAAALAGDDPLRQILERLAGRARKRRPD